MTAMSKQIKRTKNQHYVPQFMLRGFTGGNKNQVFVFDKQKQTIFRTVIRNIASESGFYDYSIKGVDESIEPFFSRMDSTVGRIVNEIRTREDIGFLNRDNRISLSLFVAVQMLRVKNARERMRGIADHIKQRLIDLNIDPAQVKNYQDADDDEIKLNSIKQITLAKEFSEHIFDKAWILMKTPASHQLYTSDNPISLHNMIERPGRGNLGLAVEGIEIYLPVSKCLCICFLCKQMENEIRSASMRHATYDQILGSFPIDMTSVHALQKAIDSGTPLELQPENVEHLNSLQVINASRFVIASSNDFLLVKEMISDHPDLQGPPGFKFE